MTPALVIVHGSRKGSKLAAVVGFGATEADDAEQRAARIAHLTGPLTFTVATAKRRTRSM